MGFCQSGEPLKPCCLTARLERVEAILPGAEMPLFTQLLEYLVGLKAPDRVDEIQDALFGTYLAETPFWGSYEHFNCPTCGRGLHNLSMDGMLVSTLDDMARRLHEIVDSRAADQLRFTSPNEDQKKAAKQALSAIVFRTEKEPPSTEVPREWPYWLVTEAMCQALAFAVTHETFHQGVQRCGAYNPANALPAVHHFASLEGLKLRSDEALAWAKELSADHNSFQIMHIGQSRSVASDSRADWGRTVAMGACFAIKSWEIMLREFSFDDPVISRRFLRTHPSAKCRMGHLSVMMSWYLSVLSDGADMLWAERLIHALDQLYGDPNGPAA